MTAGAWVAIALLAVCAAVSMVASFVWERRARDADAELDRLKAAKPKSVTVEVKVDTPRIKAVVDKAIADVVRSQSAHESRARPIEFTADTTKFRAAVSVAEPMAPEARS